MTFRKFFKPTKIKAWLSILPVASLMYLEASMPTVCTPVVPPVCFVHDFKSAISVGLVLFVPTYCLICVLALIVHKFPMLHKVTRLSSVQTLAICSSYYCDRHFSHRDTISMFRI